MKVWKKGFTLVELLVVIGIIALLLGLALPALNEARFRAREVASRASLKSVEMAIEIFADDMGHYPKSSPRPMLKQIDEAPAAAGVIEDQGAHRLVESLVGLDYLGYQVDHLYKVSPGPDEDPAYPPKGTPVVIGPDATQPLVETERKGPYVELESVDLSPMNLIHSNSHNFPFSDSDAPGGETNANPVFAEQTNVDQPRAILYYRANQSAHNIWDIYNYSDNEAITGDTLGDPDEAFHPLLDNRDNDLAPIALPEDEEFARFVWDQNTGIDVDAQEGEPKTNIEQPSARPYNRSGFLLIGAGRDGKYGTIDDINNSN